MKPVFLWRMIAVGALFGILAALADVLSALPVIPAQLIATGATLAGAMVGGALDIRANDRKMRRELEAGQ